MEPKDFARVIWRRKRTVVTAIFIVVATVLFASFRKEPEYVAQCDVLFEAVTTDPGDPNSPVIDKYGTLESNVKVVGGSEVAGRAAKTLGLDVAQVAGKVNVELLPETAFFRLQVADMPTPEEVTAWNALRGTPDAGPGARAAAICNTLGREFAEMKREQAVRYFETQVRLISSSQESVAKRLKVVLEDLRAARRSGDEDEEIKYLNDRNNLVQLLGTYEQKVAAIQAYLEFGVNEGGGELAEPAIYGVPVGADHRKDGTIGLLVGLMFGIGIALVREYMDDTMKDKESTQRELGLPVLAALPTGDEIEGLDEPSTGTIEAARKLRATLSSLGFPEDKRTLVVTSSLAKRRATTLASLAAAVAESGRSVLVIGSDLRGGRTHETFGIANTVGLANVVRGQVPFEKAIRPAPGMDGVYVLPCGPVIGNPGELLSSEAMALTLRRARNWADVVLLDAPPVLAAADSSILGAFADGVLLVVSAGQTNRQHANEAKEQLIAAGARVLGAVLVGSDEGTQHEHYMDDFDMGGGFGGWGGGDYHAAYDPSASYVDDGWYSEPISTTAYTEARAPRRRPSPPKKTAASRAGQRPKRQAQTAVPRNARTTKKPAKRAAPAKKAATTRTSTARRPASTARRTTPARTTARTTSAGRAAGRATTRRR